MDKKDEDLFAKLCAPHTPDWSIQRIDFVLQDPRAYLVHRQVRHRRQWQLGYMSHSWPQPCVRLSPLIAPVLTATGTFRKIITYELIKVLTLRDLRREDHRPFTKSLLPYILNQHTKNPSSSRIGSSGPDIIAQIRSNITAKGGVVGTNPAELTLRICQIVCNYCPTFWFRSLHPRSPHQSNDNEALVVAVGLDSNTLLDVFVQSDASVWGTTTLFGQTWKCIARRKGFRAIHNLVRQRCLRPADDRTKKAKKRTLGATIKDLLDDGLSNCAKRLLLFYISHFGRPTDHFAASCKGRARQLGPSSSSMH